jgi:uncharacterized membrane protein
MKLPRVLYAGDSPVGGAANYLLGILGSLPITYKHIPPSQMLTASDFKHSWNVIILSDFSRKNLTLDAERLLEKQVQNGTGLLMVGGWGSFSGPFGKWKGSRVERLLPVLCRAQDDRLNFPGGAIVHQKAKHEMFKNFTFQHPPVICGLNQIEPKKDSREILVVREIDTDHLKLKREYPLLVVSSRLKTAALATDLAPHWCGGWVDWGTKRRNLAVNSKIQVEVGDRYVDFVASLVNWLGRNA